MKVHTSKSLHGTSLSQNLISDLLQPSTILVLVNAIYFRGFWKTPFQKRNTRNDNFFVQPNSPKEVPTMYLKANLLTGNLDALDSRWLKLPFEVSFTLDKLLLKIVK
jgi:serine protease inhibitor